jgi:class 3 adenylate cyclase/tetratricopeptide (TPR) repeat protein
MTASLGDAEAYGLVAECLGILDEVAQKHGGHVDKYLGDCVMALFGVPIAIEDAPRAAVNAAIEMRDRIQAFTRERALEVPIDVHSGINTGLAIAGDVSGPLLREFALMGEPVVVADLLTHEAEAGHVQVGEDTWRLVRDAFEFERAGEVQVSGRADPVAAYELRSDRVQLHRQGAETVFERFVGRQAELETLGETVARLAEGRGGAVGLVSETGLGKSRLLSEVRTASESKDVRWLEGRSISIGQRLGFHPFADLLREWAGIDEEDPEPLAHEKLGAALAELFGDESASVHPFLASLLGLRLSADDQAVLDSVPGESRSSVLQASLTELLRRLAEARPLAIVFEDLHWADQSSIELIESLLRLVESVPLLVVNVFRPGHVDTSERIDAYAREHHAARYVRVGLGPLPPEAARALVDRIGVPIEVRLAIVERSVGNPLYVEEVVRSLVEEGAVTFRDGAFHATRSIDAAAIPDSVGDVVMVRVDRLGEGPKEVLRAASVIGGAFSRPVLERVVSADAALDEVLAELQSGEFIESRSDGEYAFRHPLVREVVYDGMLETVREQLHRDVAQAIEACFDDRPAGLHAMLAYHYGRGRDLENAERALFLAGDEASRSAASNEALQFFREASRLYADLHGAGGDPHKKAQLEKNLALALANSGRYEESWTHFDSALELLGERVVTSPVALQLRFARDASSVLARLYLRFGRPPASEQEQEIVALMFRRGFAQTTGQTSRFLFDSTALLRRVSRLDPASVPAGPEIYAGAVGIFSFGGISFGIGQRFLDRAFEMSRALGEEPGVFLRVMNFLHHVLAGDWSEAHEIPDAEVDRAIRGGRHFEILQYLMFLIEKRVRQGRFDSVTPLVERIEQMWDVYQYATARFAPRAAEMRVEHQRRSADAVACADAYYRETDQDSLHLYALGCRAEVQILRGDREGAEESLAEGEEILARPGRPSFHHRSAYATARFLHDLERLERGEGDRRELVKASRRSGKLALACAQRVAFRRPEVLRLQGRGAWLAGREREALGLWRRSLDAAEHLGMAPERARTCAELALRLQGSTRRAALDGRNADSFRGEARDLMESLSLHLDRDRLERGVSP